MLQNLDSTPSAVARRLKERLKGKLGELQFYFRKIPMYQQKVLVSRFSLICLVYREI